MPFGPAGRASRCCARSSAPPAGCWPRAKATTSSPRSAPAKPAATLWPKTDAASGSGADHTDIRRGPIISVQVIRPEGLTSTELADLARADRAASLAISPAGRQAARETVLRIAGAQLARGEQAEIAAGLVETVALARARGEHVEIDGGALRISSRDGLRSLRQGGHITDAHYAVALLYRAGFEARGRDLRAASLEPGRVGGNGGGGHDNDRFVAARLRRARMLDFVARADRAVAMALADKPMALRLLRSVAGEGTSLSVWGAGRAFTRNREVLVETLELVVTLAKQIARDRKNKNI